MIRAKEIIKEKGLTVASVAERMGIQQTSLSRIINGGNTTIEMIEKLATALEVEIAELFAEKLELYGIIIYQGVTYRINTRADIAKLWEMVK